jgi:hypothetical protein
MQESTDNMNSIGITNARLVKDEIIVNAVPVPRRRFRLISLVSLSLLVGIILAVIFTRNKGPNLDLAKNALLDNLKPLLTNSPGQQLDNPQSAPALALDWLLNKSNFNAC